MENQYRLRNNLEGINRTDYLGELDWNIIADRNIGIVFTLSLSTVNLIVKLCRLRNNLDGINFIDYLGELNWTAGHVRHSNTLTYVLFVMEGDGNRKYGTPSYTGLAILQQATIDLGAPISCFHQTLHNSTGYLCDYMRN